MRSGGKTRMNLLHHHAIVISNDYGDGIVKPLHNNSYDICNEEDNVINI